MARALETGSLWETLCWTVAPRTGIPDRLEVEFPEGYRDSNPAPAYEEPVE
jgi:hypothetical protein